MAISTENAGVLSLPGGWRVISRDDATLRSPEDSVVFNVQQVLYAKPEEVSADSDASLQVFSIWNSDASGKVFSLPFEILERSGEDLLVGLITARYGQIREAARENLQINFEDIPVFTWEIEPADTSEIRYKCAALFRGEKLVLVLARYPSEYEAGWSERFAGIVDRWVTSSALTPTPLPETLMAEISLPALPSPQPLSPRPLGEGLGVREVEAIRLSQPDNHTPESDLSGGVGSAPGLSEDLSVSVAAASAETFFSRYGRAGILAAVMLLVFVFVGHTLRQRRRNMRVLDFQAIAPAPITPEELGLKVVPLAVPAAEVEILSGRFENDVPPLPLVREETPDTEPEEKAAERRAFGIGSLLSFAPETTFANESADEEQPAAEHGKDEEKEEEEEAAAPEAEESHPFDLIRSEDMNFPPLSSTYDDPDHPSVWEESPAAEAPLQATAEVGFEKAYDLINQALDILESYKDVMPATRYYSNMPETPSAPPGPAPREKENFFAMPEPVDASDSEDRFEEPEDLPEPYRLKWLYVCAFALMAMADVTVSVLFAQASSAELLLSQLWGTVFTLLGNNVALMSLSCLPALAVRFSILRRPMRRGALLLFTSALSVVFGAGAFSLGTLSLLSVLPAISIMGACALAVSFYLGYRTLTWRYVDDIAEEDFPVTDEFATEPEEQPTREREARQDFFRMEPRFEQSVIKAAEQPELHPAKISLENSDEIFGTLEAAFGSSFVLDSVEDEVRRYLEGGEEEIPYLLQSVTPECFILRLCVSAIVNLMRTGRYHIGRGILSSEGQELYDLFRYVSGQLLQNGYCTQEEAAEDLEFVQSCVRERG